jgi:hypothetical protein
MIVLKHTITLKPGFKECGVRRESGP